VVRRADPVVPSGRALSRLFRVAILATLGFLALALGPDLILATPNEIQQPLRHPLTRVAVVAAFLTVPPVWVASRPPRRTRAWAAGRVARALGSPPGRAARRWADRARSSLEVLAARPIPAGLGRVSTELLHGPLTLGVAAACALMLSTWVPHYLTWPWWADTDQFATAALCWEAGTRPFRDLADFDFPGPIFVFNLLGATVGWGGTAVYNALDASLVVLLGVALACWSRRLFGRALPGLIGYLPFLAFYLTRDYFDGRPVRLACVVRRGHRAPGAGGVPRPRRSGRRGGGDGRRAGVPAAAGAVLPGGPLGGAGGDGPS
jgi:hypothetical protein